MRARQLITEMLYAGRPLEEAASILMLEADSGEAEDSKGLTNKTKNELQTAGALERQASAQERLAKVKGEKKGVFSFLTEPVRAASGVVREKGVALATATAEDHPLLTGAALVGAPIVAGLGLLHAYGKAKRQADAHFSPYADYPGYHHAGQSPYGYPHAQNYYPGY